MEPIAIIGLAFKLPQGIEDIPSLWDTLENGKNLMTAWPEDRVSIEGFYDPDQSKINKLHSKGGHFFKGKLGEFDAPFFSMSSREAAAMDPQQHILLETSYRALENAGIPLAKVAGTATGVFAGSMSDDYTRVAAKDPDEAALHSATGQTMAFLANRLSWFFDMKGPSIQINTACSSSMIAVDLACQSLRTGQSSLALVAGSSIMLGPELSLFLTNMNVLSPDSLCYAFDHRANGYGRGDGVIVFVLKRLTDAVTDGDMIRAVIRATGSNQDGHTPGISQPSITSQEELIRSVYKSSGLDFESTLYVEAHGTGTQLGDVSETKALGRVFKGSRTLKSPLYVGSIKTNIGHLEGGSGLAGMLKSILILESGIIPPSALFEKLNPKINAKGLNIQVPTLCIPWPSKGRRCISVNSFGFGGSNGHVVLDDAHHCLQEIGLAGNHLTRLRLEDTTEKENGTSAPGFDGTPPPSTSSNATSEYKVLVWSAKDEDALRRMTQHYAVYMDTHSLDANRLAYTLSVKRSTFAWRSFAVVKASPPRLPPKLPFIRASRDVSLAFVFTGQGAQYAGMGLELLAYPAFRVALERADAVFQGLGAAWSLFDAMRDQNRINNAGLSQPLGTALQLGLVHLLRGFGVVPSAVIGHSSGEIAAAYAVGALSFESACKVAYHRGRLAAELAATTCQPGAWMSVNLSEGQVKAYLDKISMTTDQIHVACVNSPYNVTLSGDELSIDRVKHHLDQDGTFARKLATGVAYHSPAMQQIASAYLSSLGDLEGQNANVNANADADVDDALMVSSATGERVSTRQLSNGQYWVNNLISTVRFSDALQYLEAAAPRADGLKPVSIYLEVGPSGTLRRPVCDTVGSMTTGKSVEYLSALSKFDSPLTSILNVTGQLFARGYPVSVTAANGQDQGCSQPFLVDIPAYPFDHSRNYWDETRLSRDWRLRRTAPRSLLGVCATDWNPLEPRWRSILSIQDTPWISHHVVGDVPYFPATGILMMALEAVRQTAQAQDPILEFVIKEFTFMSPIVVRPQSKTEVITHLRSLQEQHDKARVRFEVRMFACVDGYWNECSKAIIYVEYDVSTVDEVDGGREARATAQACVRAYEEAKRVCVTSVSKQDFYKWHGEQGLKYGPSFSLAEGASWDEDGGELCIGNINLASAEPFDGIAHPGVLDCAFQLALTAASRGMTNSHRALIIHRLEEVCISATAWQSPDARQIRVVCRCRQKVATPGLDCSVALLNDQGNPICRVKNFELLPAGARDDIAKDKGKGMDKLLYSVEWKPQLSELSRPQMEHYCRDLDTFLRLAAHEEPGQRILDIGDGFGVMTKRVLSILNQVEERNGGVAYSEYLYTEPSKTLVDEARDRLKAYHQDQRLRFSTIDVGKDTATQCLGRGAYSIIILSGEDILRRLNAREHIPTMCNLRRCLRSGGYLVVHGNGLSGHSVMTMTEWDKMLIDAGFSGIDLTTQHPDDETIVISRAVEQLTSIQGQGRETLLLIDDQDQYQRGIASSLSMTARFENAEIILLSQLATKAADNSQYKSVIFLADLGRSLLGQMAENLFTPIQRVVQNTTNLLWVTSSSYSGHQNAAMPFSGLKDGFLRTMQSKYSGKRIISLSLEGENEVCSIEEAVQHITHAFTSGFVAAKPETEYVARNGTFHIGRLMHERALDEKLTTMVDYNSNTGGARSALSKTESWLPGPPLKVQVESPGLLETIRLVQDGPGTCGREAFDDLGPTDVEIEAKFWGVSFRDAFIALGRLQENDFGTDCAGVVTRVGAHCDLERVKPGDHVCMAALGCMRMFPRADQGAVAQIPDGISFPDACATFWPAMTTWRALVDVARIKKGDKVLIHAGSGGTGQLAIQIAKLFGAEIFVTVGYNYKKQLLVETYDIPEDHIFYSRNTSFAKGIHRLTDGYGVDIVLNSLVGEGLRASWECVAPYGRFIEIGKTDIHSNSQLPMAQFASNVTFSAVDLRHMLLHKPTIIAALVRETVDMFSKGVLRPPTPLQVYKISAIEQAFRHFQTGRNSGRVMIELDSSCIVQKHLWPLRMSWGFDSKVSYVVAGGLGGIGRSILKWMVEKGAKYLIVPSRSGTAHKPDAIKTVQDLAERGVTVWAPECDVSVPQDVSRLLDECKTLPPIKGCINAAMVLNDTMFGNMTHSQWERTVRSKVQTSWNLHNLLPDDVDVFVLLSSISGVIGNAGQSNYAAACTFQDALAQYRTHKGQRAVSIDIGVVRDVGVVAESEGVQGKLAPGLRESSQVSESKILAFLDLYCNPEKPPTNSCQMIMGLATPAGLHKRGLELPDFMHRPLFAAYASPSDSQDSIGAGGNANYGALFRQADSAEARASIVFDSLAKKLANALSIRPEDIDPSQGLHAFGVDSLVATEIRNWLAKEFGAEVAVFELTGGRSVSAICDFVTRMTHIQLKGGVEKKESGDGSSR